MNPPEDNETLVDDDVVGLYNDLPKVALKPGLKLPKTKQDWDVANDFFKLHIIYTSDITDVNQEIRSFNDVVYKFFSILHQILKFNINMRTRQNNN